MNIDFFIHNINQDDISKVCETMKSLFLTTGPVVAEFERKLARYLGVKEAVGLTSCTGAIHLALLRLGVGPGDEVITTPMTFAATATAIIQAGARPVFADVCPKSGLLAPEAAETAVTEKTKAIIPVHLYGRMADMRGFARIAAKFKLSVIEDAAHCIEGCRDGARPGQLSSAACFSFYPTKSITCGEGGALACDSSEDADWHRSARHHGISKNAAERYFKKFQHWNMDFMGWKYNMDDIKAALLVNQIDRLDEYRLRRQELETIYRERLSNVSGLDFIESPGKDEISAHHLFTVLLPRKANRDQTALRLQEMGIGCAVNYVAVHNLSFFRKTYGYKPEDFPIANEIGERTLTLPLYPRLTNKQAETVCDALKEILC